MRTGSSSAARLCFSLSYLASFLVSFCFWGGFPLFLFLLRAPSWLSALLSLWQDRILARTVLVRTLACFQLLSKARPALLAGSKHPKRRNAFSSFSKAVAPSCSCAQPYRFLYPIARSPLSLVPNFFPYLLLPYSTLVCPAVL